MGSETVLSKEFPEAAETEEGVDNETRVDGPREVSANSGSSNRVRLASFLKNRRNELGVTQQCLAQKLGVRASHIALLENHKRRPSLRLLVRLAAALNVDGKELLELAYPEIRTLISPTPKHGVKLGRSWQRLFNNTALLSRYRVTRQELEVLQHLGMLGGRLTVKRLLVILLLVRDIP